MFEHRLGLALNKTIAEVRALPYPEYHAWELYYLIEPFGWRENEYSTAALLAMLYNVNRGKGKAKDVGEFMRDIPSAILNELKDKPDISELSREEIIKLIKKDFGIK